VNGASSHLEHMKRTRLVCLVVFTAMVLCIITPLTQPQSVNPPTVFELEVPDFNLLPSNQPEITIPYASVNQIFVHILKPAADNINYGSIRTYVNGQAAASISEVVAGARGKIVRMNLKQRPGYELVSGRNTVEVWAQNRLGRMYYSSFIVTTATQNWNDDFTYSVFPAPSAGNEDPPQLLLLEPVSPVQIPPSMTNMLVKISGLASATTVITKITVDGKTIPFKPEPERTRQLTRMGGAERGITFDAVISVNRNTNQIVVEAEDRSGTRTRVSVPVFLRKPGEVMPVRGQKYALIIGISRYRNSGDINNLEYADVDARSVYEFLQQPAAGGFSRENMRLLLNENATLASIRRALTDFVTRASTNDLLLIFFAGHGAPDRFAPQNLYVIAHDTHVGNMPATALAMPELLRYVEQNIKSKRVVMLMDACHSAGLSNDGTRDLPNNLANQYLQQLLYQEEGRAVITSSDVNEKSLESRKWGNGHGVFTFYVLEGLKGHADLNQDRFVSVGELFRYVRQKVRLDTNLQQNPRMLTGANENLAISVAQSR
jgi:hypothetical protein